MKSAEPQRVLIGGVAGFWNGRLARWAKQGWLRRVRRDGRRIAIADRGRTIVDVLGNPRP